MPLNLHKQDVPERTLTKRRQVSQAREVHPREELVMGLRSEGGPGRELPDSNSKRVKEYMDSIDRRKNRLRRLRPAEGFVRPDDREIGTLLTNRSVSVYDPDSTSGTPYYTIELFEDPQLAGIEVRVTLGNFNADVMNDRAREKMSARHFITDEQLTEADVLGSLYRYAIDQCLRAIENKIDQELE